MWTRLLMISSAAVMLLLGALLTFAPREVLVWTGSQASSLLILAVQALGALYLGFAALNWMAKGKSAQGSTGGISCNRAVGGRYRLRDLCRVLWTGGIRGIIAESASMSRGHPDGK